MRLNISSKHFFFFIKVTCKFKATEGGKYIVLVSLFHSGQSAAYSLHLFASLAAPAKQPISFKPNPGKQYLFAQVIQHPSPTSPPPNLHNKDLTCIYKLKG